jgi:hypothetical protein
MNYIIPTVLLLAMIVISYYQHKEYKSKKRVKGIVKYFEDVTLTEEQMMLIEQTVQRDILFCREYWRGRFNTSHYVKLLEYKHSKGLM